MHIKTIAQNTLALISVTCFIFITNCEQRDLEPASATSPQLIHNDERPQLPYVQITQLDQWLAFPLSHSNQLRQLGATHSFIAQKPYNSALGKCSAQWSSLEGVYLNDWPKKYANARIHFYMRDGLIEVMMIFFQEVYPSSRLSAVRIWDQFQYKVGLEDELHHLAKLHHAGELENALQPLDDLVQSQCTVMTHHTKEVGYECNDFALSYTDNSPFDLHYMIQILEFLETDEDLSEQEKLKAFWEMFEKPSSPMYVKHEICDGCYGSQLVIYRNKNALRRFIQEVVYQERLLCPGPKTWK